MVGCRSMKALIEPDTHIITHDGQDDGADHDGQLIGLGESHRGEHRVQREHDVDDGDLHHDGREAGEHARACARPPTPSSVSWISVTLLASRNRPPSNRMMSRPENSCRRSQNQRLGQPRQPHDGEQQRDAREHRQREAGDARRLAPLRRQPAHQDGDEDDVVDAEHDLERRQRDERYPRLRIGQQLHHRAASSPSLTAAGRWGLCAPSGTGAPP